MMETQADQLASDFLVPPQYDPAGAHTENRNCDPVGRRCRCRSFKQFPTNRGSAAISSFAPGLVGGDEHECVRASLTNSVNRW
jgi:hypothetical protein